MLPTAGQAQAPDLWAIPGTPFRDEWDSQTGRGIRRVRKIVLDGTEAWGENSKVLTYSLKLSDAKSENVVDSEDLSICSHFAYRTEIWSFLDVQYGYVANLGSYQFRALACETLDAWKAYLAAQYAAGTPVTIWYALADPEPFYHPPAKLTMPTGYGQIIQVSGDVLDCPITARYLTHS